MGLVLSENDFYERVANSNKTGFSYVGIDMFIVPDSCGWKMVDKSSWKCVYYSTDKKALYRFYRKSI